MLSGLDYIRFRRQFVDVSKERSRGFQRLRAVGGSQCRIVILGSCLGFLRSEFVISSDREIGSSLGHDNHVRRRRAGDFPFDTRAHFGDSGVLRHLFMRHAFIEVALAWFSLHRRVVQLFVQDREFVCGIRPRSD